MSVVVAVGEGPGELVVTRGDSSATPIASDALIWLSEKDDVTLDSQPDSHDVILSRLRPDEEWKLRLDEAWDEALGEYSEDEVPGLSSLVIDRQTWTWFLARYPTNSYEGRDEWMVVPPGESREVARLSAWMTASMTGAVMLSGVRVWDRDVALVYFDDDESNPDGDIRKVMYSCRSWDDLAIDAASLVFRDFGEAPCPYCETGWEIEGSFDAMFSTEGIASALISMMKPCNDHLDVEDGDVFFAQREWRWTKDRWAPAR